MWLAVTLDVPVASGFSVWLAFKRDSAGWPVQIYIHIYVYVYLCTNICNILAHTHTECFENHFRFAGYLGTIVLHSVRSSVCVGLDCMFVKRTHSLRSDYYVRICVRVCMRAGRLAALELNWRGLGGLITI